MFISGLLTKLGNRNPPFQKVNVRDPPMHTSIPKSLARPLAVLSFTFSVLITEGTFII